MRIRFFLVTLAMLTIVSIATITLNSYFSTRRQLALLDQQVKDTTMDLVDSDLSKLPKTDPKNIGKIISKDLGEDEIGKIFIVRDHNENIIYQSPDVKFLPSLDIPVFPDWLTLNNRGNFIRILNTKTADHILQVGIVVEEDLLNINALSKSSLSMTSAIFVLGLLTAWVLTSSLFQPISILVSYLTTVAKNPLDRHDLPVLPSLLSAIKQRNRTDEMQQLITSFEGLIDRVRRAHHSTLAWSHHMAHELKTPLTILKAEIAQNVTDKELHDRLQKEVNDIQETINSFLDLAELNGASASKNLHANKISLLLKDISDRLSVKYPDRLHLQIFNDFYILSEKRFLEQTLVNLVMNALIYSGGKSQVTLATEENSILVKDEGGGLPPAILKRLGEPFNKGVTVQRPEGVRSHGLGLAYVYTVCKVYGWKLNFDRNALGSEVRITFPPAQIEEA